MSVTGPKLVASRVSRTHIDRTVAAWRGRKLSEASINIYKTALRGFGE
jgi:hypothetical protein